MKKCFTYFSFFVFVLEIMPIISQDKPLDIKNTLLQTAFLFIISIIIVKKENKS